MATQDAHKELFLDMLTKEEKEALLTKKMENLRKQNEAIQKRYAEVEADKKRAEVKLGSKPSAQKETFIMPRAQPQSEDHDPRKPKQMQQVQQTQQQQNSRPATRNKPPPTQGGGGGGRGARERPKSQDFRSDAAYEYEPIVDIADLDSRHAKRALSPSKARRNAYQDNAPVVSNSFHSAFPPERSVESSNNLYRPRQGRFYGTPAGQLHDSPGRGGHSRGGHGGRIFSQTFSRCSEGRDPSEFGPPPDPAYNYLSDRTRDSVTGGRQQDKAGSQDSPGGGGGLRGGKDPRRHPRNFGGPDFNNVRQQMKTVKEKEKDRRSYPPRNRLEMSVNMTGSERVQYDEWKAERQKVDQERIDRQKTSSGEWRRAWDQEKHYKEQEEPQSPGRTEPARRPVGRIGSGRFDRGDRDDRRQEALSQSPKAPSMLQNAPFQESSERKHQGAGRGRGRGRGRARAQQGGEACRPGEKPPRPRTWSGGDDSRTVECSNDMLVVKIDKSRSSDDHSVEVEYEETEKRKSSPSKKKAGRKSPTKQRQQQYQQPLQQLQFQDAEMPGVKGVPRPAYSTMSSQDSSNYEGCPPNLSQSLSVGSTDDWEDVSGTDSHATTTEDEAESLKRTGKLNPEAPVFLPSSPDLAVSPPTGFGLPPPKEQRNRSPRVAGGLTGSLNIAAGSFTAPSTGSTPKQPSTQQKAATAQTVNGKVTAHEEFEEEEEEEEATPEREIAAEDEEKEEEFEDFEEKMEEEGITPEKSLDSQSAVEDKEEAELQGDSSFGEELSTPAPSSSLADELSAAGAPRPHSDGVTTTPDSAQDNTASQNIHEIEEDDLVDEDEAEENALFEQENEASEESKEAEAKGEESLGTEENDSESSKGNKETVPDVTDKVPTGEALPEKTAAASETETVVEEKQSSANADADSSCTSAPADGSSTSSPQQGTKQMAASGENGGSSKGAVKPYSSQLISTDGDTSKESATSDVMEKPDAEHVNGNTDDATAKSHDSVAMETTSTTSLSE